jgi:transcriptional regulator with XRE-family HTH domain
VEAPGAPFPPHSTVGYGPATLDAAEAIKHILSRLKGARVAAGKSPHDVEEALILGDGWIERFESGDSVPQIDLLIAMATEYGTDLAALVEGIKIEEAATVQRLVHAEATDEGIAIHFPYGEYQAVYDLDGATLDDFEDVLGVLRNSLAAGKKTEAVTDAFLRAVELWPDANPSDLWWFVVPRAYYDRFNHPATNALLNVDQSWKRTGGWALERVLVRHYEKALAKCGVRIWIPTKAQKQKLLPAGINVDKVDVVLSGTKESENDFFGEDVFFGAVHVKASFAERRDDDVPLSRQLMEAGYTSIFWTMDSKSGPSAKPFNRGELGALLGEGDDERSQKRKDFEVLGSFSACFSYNRNTKPTPPEQDAKAHIYQVDFSNADGDAFTKFVCDAWNASQATNS